MKWDWCSGLDRRSTEISPQRPDAKSHTKRLDTALLGRSFSHLLGKVTASLSQQLTRGCSQSFLLAGWGSKGCGCPPPSGLNAEKYIKNTKLEWCAGKETFSCMQRQDHCHGGSEVRGWASPGRAQPCSGLLHRESGVQTRCCSTRGASRLETRCHRQETQQQ